MTNDSPRENPVAIVETLHPNLGTSALACTFLELLIADLMFLRKVPISRWSHTVVAEAVQVNIVFHNTFVFSQRFTWIGRERPQSGIILFSYIFVCRCPDTMARVRQCIAAPPSHNTMVCLPKLRCWVGTSD